MLACARLGAVHSVVFGGFAAQELARRIEHAEVQLNFCFYCFYQFLVLSFYSFHICIMNNYNTFLVFNF